MKTPPELHDERVSSASRHSFQNRLLRESMLEFLVGKYVSLRDSLESIQIAGGPMLHKQNLPSAPLAQHSHHLKIVDDHLPAFLLGIARHGCLFLRLLGMRGRGFIARFHVGLG